MVIKHSMCAYMMEVIKHIIRKRVYCAALLSSYVGLIRRQVRTVQVR